MIVVIEERNVIDPTIEFVEFHPMAGYAEPVGQDVLTSARLVIVVPVHVRWARHVNANAAPSVSVCPSGGSLLRVVGVVVEVGVWRTVPA